MKKTAYLFNILAFLMVLGISGVNAKSVMAGAKLYLDPSSGARSLNESFTVTVNVDSAGESVGGVDVIGTYDSSRLELVSVSKASNMVFDNVDGGGTCSIIDSSDDGKFSFSCNANSAVGSGSVNGDLAVLSFKAKATGTATVNFTCSGTSTVDSNIVKSSTSADIISCTENGNGSYTINSSSSSNNDSSSSTSTNSDTSETTELPQTGSVGVTVGLVSFGLISLVSAVFLKFL